MFHHIPEKHTRKANVYILYMSVYNIYIYIYMNIRIFMNAYVYI